MKDIMKSFKHYKTKVYDKWKPTQKIMFWLTVIFGLLGLIVGGTYIININMDNNQIEINNSSLDKSPVCVGDNCEQNIYYSEEETKEKLIITPSDREFNCDGWDKQFPLKITNNYDHPLFNIDIKFELSGINAVSDFNLTPKFEPDYIDLGEYQVNTRYYGIGWHYDNQSDGYLLHITNIDAHDSIEFWTKMDMSNCNDSVKFKITHIDYKNETEIILTQ